MNNQVLSIEQMEELIELGIDTSKASIFWVVNVKNPKGTEDELLPPFLTIEKNINIKEAIGMFDVIPTFTLQDILEMLPKKFPHWKEGVEYRLYMSFIGSICFLAYEAMEETAEYTYENVSTLHRCYGSPIEAAFQMLKWYCKQNKLV